MEASIVAEQVDVREKPEAGSSSIAQLAHGARVILGDITFKKAWVEIRLMDGRSGFIPGNTPVRSEPMSQWLIGQTPWDIHVSRDAASPSLPSPAAGQLAACGAVSKVGETSWTEVLLRNGQTGYIAGHPSGDHLVWAELPAKLTHVYEAPTSATKVTSLSTDHIVAVGSATEAGGKQWARVVLPNGTSGYLSPGTPIIRLDPAQALPRFRTVHGTCTLCRKQRQVHMVTLHLTDRGPDGIYGAVYVPACASCLKWDFRKNVSLLIGAGVAGTVVTFAVGLEFIGMVAFTPLALYFFNTLQSAGDARRYRQLCAKARGAELAQYGVQVREPVDNPEENLPDKWAQRRKWIVCPGCLNLHREQSPWCPQCGYLFFWRISPLT